MAAGGAEVSAGLEAARRALAGRPAWLVGGAVRDALLGRPTADFDIVVEGDPAAAARAVADAAGRAACFELSEEFGAWRIVAREARWQVDVTPLRAGSLSEDLALRDFTVNAIAEPLAGGSAIDPLGGAADLRARRLRAAGPGAFADDPLRVLRLVRVAVELGLEPDVHTLELARAQAGSLPGVSGERVLVELRQIVASPAPREGIELMSRLGALAAVLPELEALRGVEQSAYHHADVYEHTLEVLDRSVELTAPGAAERGDGASSALGSNRERVAVFLAEPLADEMTRGQALRWGALLHDAAKPLTRAVSPQDGRVTFMGHDVAGVKLARGVLGRLCASERLRAHVAALVRNHLRLGFLVHDPQPLARRTVYRYLRACAPVQADVTLLSVADRLATRGRRSEEAIDAHLRLAADVLDDALRWHEQPLPAALLRGDALPNDTGYVTICPGESINFAALGTGPGVFPQDGILYDQDASTSLFIWDFGDGVIDTGQVINHTYANVHGYDVLLTVIDDHGCVNTNFMFLRVAISGNPIGSVNPLPNICSKEDTLEISVGYGIDNVIQVVPINSVQGASQTFDSTMFIPDGPDCGVNCYNTEVTFTAFAPGATVTSSSDVQSICINMEHTFAGDLGFTIYCPNGQYVNLDPNTHSGGADLGIANFSDGSDDCDPSFNPPGTGWPYCWSEIYPTSGTLTDLDGGFTSPIDSTNQMNHTNYIEPDNAFSGLIGCPLNGTWNIQICDDYGIDNGYIFEWTLNLDPSLLQTTGWSYDVPIDSFAWGGNYIVATSDSSIFVYPSTGGLYYYSLTIYDAFGCTYDTTLAITVVTSPEVNLGNDTTICAGNMFMLDAGNPGSIFNWSTLETTQNIFVNTSGTYSVTVTNTDGAALYCTDIDEINVNFFPMPVVDLGPDICSETTVNLDAYPGVGTFTYIWSTGETTQTISISNSDIYWVHVESGAGSVCADSDTIGINIVPHPVIDLGPDTTLCAQRSVELFANQLPDSPEYIYQWIDNQGSTISTSSSTTFSPGNPGTYMIIVTKTGCTSESDTINVEGILCEVTVPNVITPTNGDGFNDYFVIVGLENYPNTQVLIFNRWGNKVYESSNYQNDWDGGGESDGVYYYVITFPDFIEPMTGTVTIFSK